MSEMAMTPPINKHYLKRRTLAAFLENKDNAEEMLEKLSGVLTDDEWQVFCDWIESKIYEYAGQ